jgi:hypothetical protein
MIFYVTRATVVAFADKTAKGENLAEAMRAMNYNAACQKMAIRYASNSSIQIVPFSSGFSRKSNLVSAHGNKIRKNVIDIHNPAYW